jgi:hypothetical protein
MRPTSAIFDVPAKVFGKLDKRAAIREFVDAHFRAEAERLAWAGLQNRWHMEYGDRVGRPLTQVTVELGIQPSMLRNWHGGGRSSPTPAVGASQREAIAAFLRRVLLRVEALVDHDSGLVEENRAEDVGAALRIARNAKQLVGVGELEAELEVRGGLQA